jgi:hypothetical protein
MQPWCLSLCGKIKPCRACPNRPRAPRLTWGHIRSGDDLVDTTNLVLVRRLVEHFRPTGFCLDPCKGPHGAFFNALPEPKDWCEIREGRDFLKWQKRVDWIMTNPAWSAQAYRAIARHAFEIAENVVFLTRWHNATGTYARDHDWLDAGHGLKETIIIPWRDAGFLDRHGNIKQEGYKLAAFHWERGWKGEIKPTRWDIA